MELVMTIHVIISKKTYNIKGEQLSVCMVPFTGTAEGPYFNGTIIGEGVDTQKIYPNGKIMLSARYMLEGQDFNGNKCSVFIENNGETLEKCKPLIATDSVDLQFLTEAELISNVIPNENGVEVRIYNNI